MIIKVGCKYTTDKGYVLRCLTQSILKKGESDGKGKWKKAPQYIYSLIVLDGPDEKLHKKHISYYASGLPARFNDCGKIVDELTNA